MSIIAESTERFAAQAETANLLSRAAADDLKGLAAQAWQRTQQYFGKTIKLYAPLYLSNYCTNACPYCGFSTANDFKAKLLNIEEVESEAKLIAAAGIREILLVAGDDPRRITAEYVARCAEAVKKIVPAVSIETASFTEDEYRTLNSAGVDGLTLYQETYDRELYDKLHRGGLKEDYGYRYETHFRAAAAGIRRLGVGALLGLRIDWRSEMEAVIAHAVAIQKKHWKATVSVSFPRINPCLSDFTAPYELQDAELVQAICAARLSLPQCDMVLSTREPALIRDNLLGIGITKISAGSQTAPGGYGTVEGQGEQFSVSDSRSPQEIAQVLMRKGFQPVWKDWEACMK